MSIESIDQDLCDGCGLCVESCPADVLRLGERKPPWAGEGWVAHIAYSEDCHACLLCTLDCPRGAIKASAFLETPPGWFPYKLPEQA